MLRKAYWLLVSQLGFNPKTLMFSLRGLPYYIRSLCIFRKNYKRSLSVKPCLHDWYEEAGSAFGEYFFQDLLVARLIHDARPRRHVDVGSRVDGFIAHVASFRGIDMIDVRPIQCKIPGVTFIQADLMNSGSLPTQKCDSLSCLHALEHFGLGRYGDMLDVNGHEVGFRNMSNLLENNGIFYLSTPIGRERVEFNANRVFNPNYLLELAASFRLELRELILIRKTHTSSLGKPSIKDLEKLGQESYALALFVFEKKVCD